MYYIPLFEKLISQKYRNITLSVTDKKHYEFLINFLLYIEKKYSIVIKDVPVIRLNILPSHLYAAYEERSGILKLNLNDALNSGEKNWSNIKVYKKYEGPFLHEYTHFLDFIDYKFQLSDILFPEYVNCIKILFNKTNDKIFNYRSETSLYNWNVGLKGISGMSGDEFYNYEQKYEKLVQSLGYPSAYSLMTIQEFVSESMEKYFTKRKILNNRIIKLCSTIESKFFKQ